MLRLAYGDLTLMVPADNAEEIGLREVINDEEVEEVFAVLRKKEARMPTNWSRRFKNHVEKLKSGDIYQVAEVVRNLSIREDDKGLSAGEKRMLARARQILVSELTFALNVDEEAAEARLDEVLKGEDKPPAKKPGQEGRRQEVAAPADAWASGVGGGRRRRVGASASAAPSSSADLGGARLVDHAVATAAAACDAVVLVVPDASEWEGAEVDALGHRRRDPRRVGARRAGRGADRRRRSSSCTTPRARWRPPTLFDAVIGAVRGGADGAVPGLAVADTLKRVDGRARHRHRRPGAGWSRCRRPRRSAPPSCAPRTRAGSDATDDAALVEAVGGTRRGRPRRPAQPQDHRARRPHDRRRAARGVVSVSEPAYPGE